LRSKTSIHPAKTFESKTYKKPANLKLKTRGHFVFSDGGCQENFHQEYFSPRAQTLGNVIGHGGKPSHGSEAVYVHEHVHVDLMRIVYIVAETCSYAYSCLYSSFQSFEYECEYAYENMQPGIHSVFGRCSIQYSVPYAVSSRTTFLFFKISRILSASS
jgi:hypothetical protein